MRTTGSGVRVRWTAGLGAILTLLAACTSSSSAGSAQTGAPATPTTKAGATPTLGDPYTRADVTAMYQADGGQLRLRLPKTLPDIYEFVGFVSPDVRQTRNGEQVVARKAWFDVGQNTFTVCVENTARGAGICPDTNIGVSRTRNGTLWTVSSEVPVSYDTEVWGEAAYSVDPADWAWLQQ